MQFLGLIQRSCMKSTRQLAGASMLWTEQDAASVMESCRGEMPCNNQSQVMTHRIWHPPLKGLDMHI
jgi:hypothetical protein